jgi:hypothetical protein
VYFPKDDSKERCHEQPEEVGDRAFLAIAAIAVFGLF